MTKKIKYLLLLMSLSITLCVMSNTYSKYAADTTGSVEASFAKWQILVNTEDITAGAEKTLNITPTIEANSHVAANKLAPASTGYFDIEIDPTHVEVSYDYSIRLSAANESMPYVKINQYAILDENYEEGNTITKTNVENDEITGTENYSAGGFKPYTVRVYFEWVEGSGETMNDAADTAVGHNALNEDTDSIEMTATIHFEQKISD